MIAFLAVALIVGFVSQSEAHQEPPKLLEALQQQIVEACKPDEKWCIKAASQNKTRVQFLEDKIESICKAQPSIAGCQDDHNQIKRWTDDWWYQYFNKEFNKYPNPYPWNGYAPLSLKETVVNTGEHKAAADRASVVVVEAPTRPPPPPQVYVVQQEPRTAPPPSLYFLNVQQPTTRRPAVFGVVPVNLGF